MFAKSIVLSDAFLDMAMSARCLYFTLGMLADDDGFVGNPKSIMRQCGASNDDILMLLQKRYVLDCGNGVLVIKHWRMNNYLQKDRYKETTYLEEKDKLIIDDKGSYTEKNKQCIQNVYTGKVSIGKVSIGNIYKTFIPPTLEDVEEYCKKRNNNVNPSKFYDYYSVSNWVDGSGKKIKNWKQKVITWERNNPKKEDTLPTYDNSKNISVSKQQEQELLEIMGKE